MVDSRLSQLMKHDDTARQHTEDASVAPAKEHPLVGMQRAVGNAAVARMLAQREGEEDEMAMKRDPSLQRDSEGGEAEEEEMAMKRDPSLQRDSEGGEAEEEEMAMKRDPSLQREGEEDEMAMKRADAPAVGLEGGPAGSELTEAISSQRGGGTGLAGSVREKMEGAFGTSFGNVRVHNDATSDALNRQVTAKAFTTGNDIFLRSDSSAGDESLMAHELTHVVQQRSMGGGGGGMHVGAAGSEHEQEADAVATEVTSGVAARDVDEHR